MLRLDNGESGQLTTPLTTQTLTYIGSTGEADSAPTYSSNHVVVNGESLTTSIGRLDNRNHSTLQSLGSDDHTQYLLVSGARAMGGALDMGTHLIHNVVDPVAAQDAATKNYVDTNATTPSFVSTNYIHKTGSVAESANGIKTFTDETRNTASVANPPASGTAVLSRNSSVWCAGLIALAGNVATNIFNLGSSTRTSAGNYTVTYSFPITGGAAGATAHYVTAVDTELSNNMGGIVTSFNATGFSYVILDDSNGNGMDSLAEVGSLGT